MSDIIVVEITNDVVTVEETTESIIEILAGDKGDPGATGPAGADGKTILNGTGAPGAGLGVDGDFYIDTAADSLYGPKTGGAWGSGTSLIGPTGATGPQGPAGADAVPAGSGTEIQFRNGSVLGAAINASIENGNIRLPAISTPAAPASGGINLFSRTIANKILPAFIGPSGLDTALNPHFGRNKIGMVSGAGNGSTITNFNILTNSATGTATANNVATTNIYTQMRKLEYLVTVAATNAVAGFRKNALQEWNEKGYHFICQWGPSTGVSTATARAFVGMRGSANAPTDVNPSTLTNIIGMGWDDSDTNIQVMHNDGSGTATKIDLGANFPVPTSDRAEIYEIALFAVPNGDVHYEVTRLSTGDKATGTISTDKPAQTQLMTVLGYTSVGGTSSVTGIGFVHYYLETDY